MTAVTPVALGEPKVPEVILCEAFVADNVNNPAVSEIAPFKKISLPATKFNVLPNVNVVPPNVKSLLAPVAVKVMVLAVVNTVTGFIVNDPAVEVISVPPNVKGETLAFTKILLGAVISLPKVIPPGPVRVKALAPENMPL